MANLAASSCLLALILLEGSASSAFFLPSRNTKSRVPNPKHPQLKNAYLETLTVADKDDHGTFPTAMFNDGSSNLPRGNVAETKSSPPEVSSASTLPLHNDHSTKGFGQNQTVMEPELMPQQGSSAPPDPIPGANGWARAAKESQDTNVVGKASYESERKKYNQSFQHNHDKGEDTTVHQATVVEVLPKDPLLEDVNHDYLTSKNIELERENSDLQRENERQKIELESFLRSSLSNPLDHRAPDTILPPWHDDGIVALETHTRRLESENEMQRQDLQAIQSEMNGMQSAIQSIEDRSYMETQELQALNDELQNENERQKEQLKAYSVQLSDMQNLIQTIREEGVALENEKQKLERDNDLLITKLGDSERDGERKTFDLGDRNEQISDLQKVIVTLQSENSNLQNQRDLVVNDKASLESKFGDAVREFEKQRQELENYKKDRTSMESLVHSIRQESEALKSDNKELQNAIVNMKVAMEDLSQEHVVSQNKVDTLSSEKEEIILRNEQVQGQLQSQLQDSFSKLESMSGEKTEMELRLQSLEAESERQRYEIENSSRDKRALEVMVQSMQNELEALKSDKATMETALVDMQQEKQKLEHELGILKEETERLESEKNLATSQNKEYQGHYQELQLRFQEVLGELEACQEGASLQHPSFEYDGMNEDDFMNRINTRRQNQMRMRNQMSEPPLNDGWWK